jgi:hypothetical protein
VELVVHPGGKHGWLTMLWDIHHFADWFDQHLSRQTATGSLDRPENPSLALRSGLGLMNPQHGELPDPRR